MELEEELEKQPAHHKRYVVAYNRPGYQEKKRETKIKVCFSVPTVIKSCQTSLCGGYILLSPGVYSEQGEQVCCGSERPCPGCYTGATACSCFPSVARLKSESPALRLRICKLIRERHWFSSLWRAPLELRSSCWSWDRIVLILVHEQNSVNSVRVIQDHQGFKPRPSSNPNPPREGQSGFEARVHIEMSYVIIVWAANNFCT